MTVLLITNHALGMVRQWQCLFNEERYSATDIYDPLRVDYLCKAYGIEYAKATNEEELDKAFANRPEGGVYLVELLILRRKVIKIIGVLQLFWSWLYVSMIR